MHALSGIRTVEESKKKHISFLLADQKDVTWSAVSNGSSGVAVASARLYTNKLYLAQVR